MAWGEFGDDWRGSLLEAQVQHLNNLVAHGQLNDKSVVLDLGSGLGSNAMFLAKNFGCKVLGVGLAHLSVCIRIN